MKQSCQKRKYTLLQSKVVSTIAWLKNANELVTLYKAREVYPSGAFESAFLGTTSNRAASCKPWIGSNELTYEVMIAVNKADIPAGANLLMASKSIDKSNALLKEFFCDDTDTPLDAHEKIMVRLPVCVPLPFGSFVKPGTVDQNTFTSFEDIDDKLLPFWLRHIQLFNKDLQDCLQNNASLKEFRPVVASQGHFLADSPYLPLIDVDESDDDLVEHQNGLENECLDIAKANIAAAMGSLKAQSQNSQSNGINVTPVKTVDLAGSDGDSTGEPEYSDTQYFNSRIYALGMRYDADAGKVTPPVISRLLPQVRDAKSGTTQRNVTRQALSSTEAKFSEGDHFLARVVDMPDCDNVVVAYLGKATFSDQTIDSLDISKSNGVTLPMLCPDNATVARQKAEQADVDMAEDALAEHHSRRTKLSTSFTAVSAIMGINFLLGTFANCIVVFLVYWKFDFENLNSAPSIVVWTVKLAKKITTSRARKWMKKSSHEKRTKLFYYVLSQLSAILTGFGVCANDLNITAKILDGKYDEIDCSEYATIYSSFKELDRVLGRIFLGSQGIPDNEWYNNSADKKRIDDRDRKNLFSDFQLATPRGGGRNNGKAKDGEGDEGPDSKKQKTGDKSSSWGPKKGFLKVSGSNINLPGPLFNSDYKLCKSNATDGISCQMGKNCKKDHSWPADMPDERGKVLAQWVSKTPDVEFVNVATDLIAKLSL